MNKEELEQSKPAQALRAAMVSPQPGTDEAVQVIVRRAQNELALRDVMSFGFAHLFRSMLTFLASVFKSTKVLDSKNNSNDAP